MDGGGMLRNYIWKITVRGGFLWLISVTSSENYEGCRYY
ncbi:hypothetical protein DSUL_140113 [Desulfovibrionales bacterium]